jgi:hypothetical protein
VGPTGEARQGTDARLIVKPAWLVSQYRSVRATRWGRLRLPDDKRPTELRSRLQRQRGPPARRRPDSYARREAGDARRRVRSVRVPEERRALAVFDCGFGRLPSRGRDFAADLACRGDFAADLACRGDFAADLACRGDFAADLACRFADRESCLAFWTGSS